MKAKKRIINTNIRLNLCDAAAPGAEIGFGEIPYQEKQVMYLCADISDLEKDTGFAPRVTFAEGIEKTVDWCRKNYV